MFPIRPSYIDSKEHFFNAFRNHETEISAARIVGYCQENGDSWKAFTEEEIENYYIKGGYVKFRFNRLVTDGWIQIRKTGDKKTYQVTVAFIACCFKSSPSAAIKKMLGREVLTAGRT